MAMAQPLYPFYPAAAAPAAASPSTPTGPSFAASSPGFAPSPMYTPHGRKRGATDSPPAEAGPSRQPESKRRRPNLSNGFQAMSIRPSTRESSPAPGWMHHMTPGHASEEEDHDEGLEPTQPPLDGDVGIEVLPDHLHGTGTHRLKRPRAWKRNSSFSSTSPSESDDYESDATFRLPTRPSPPVQASSVEMPPDSTPTPQDPLRRNSLTVEVLDTPSKRKRAEDAQPRKRRREGMDIDMDSMMLPEGSYGPGWYEPEKDRIIITSLSSPESSPPPPDRTRTRSLSPSSDQRSPSYSYNENRHLSQPGSQGFTISPSLLTHILKAQREQLANAVPPDYSSPERGLVLYRPLGMPAPGQMPDGPVVQEWGWGDAVPGHQMRDDPSRFEEVDSDEDLSNSNNAAGMDMGMSSGMGMDMGMGMGMAMDGMYADQGWNGGDEAMDVE